MQRVTTQPGPRATVALVTGSEDGYLLLAVLVLVALLLLSLAIAAPKVAVDLRRDKETEAMHRGMQYARAIRLYYKKFGSYPTSIDQLEHTNDIRFLRKRYTDPITGKNDWRLIHMGEARVAPTGMFGQALQTGMTSVTTGPNGAGSATGGPIAATGSSTDPNSGAGAGFGSNAGSSSGFGASAGTGAGNGAAGGTVGFGSGSNFGSGSGSSSAGGFSFGNNGGASGAGQATGTPGTGTTGTSTAGAGTTGTANGTGNNGTFGGAGPIVGIGIPVAKASIREFKKQKHYNEWEFVYDPTQDEGGQNGQTGAGMVQGAGGNVIQQTGATGGDTSGAGSSSGSGFGGNNGGFGSSSSGFGSSSGSGFGGNNGGFGSSSGGFGNPPSTPPPSGAPQ